MTTPRGVPSPALVACKAIMLARVSAAAKAVGAVLIEHINWKTGRCDPSLATIAELTGYSRSNCQAGLDQLIKAGLIVVTIHGSSTSHRNKYEFQWSEINRRAQAMALKSGPSRPRKQGVDGPENRARTFCINHSKKPEPVVNGEPPSAPTGRKGQAEGSEPTRQLYLTHALPGGKAKPSGQVAAAEAERRWERDLRTRLPPAVYADAVAAITPEIQRAATEAEQRRRGAGFDQLVADLGAATFPSTGEGERMKARRAHLARVLSDRKQYGEPERICAPVSEFFDRVDDVDGRAATGLTPSKGAR